MQIVIFNTQIFVEKKLFTEQSRVDTTSSDLSLGQPKDNLSWPSPVEWSTSAQILSGTSTLSFRYEMFTIFSLTVA